MSVLLTLLVFLSASTQVQAQPADASKKAQSLLEAADALDSKSADTAAALLAAELEQRPGDCNLHALLAVLYSKEGNTFWALREAQAANELCPDDVGHKALLGWLLLRSGQAADAGVLLKGGPRGSGTRTAARAAYLEALTKYKLGKLEQAAADFAALGGAPWDSIGRASAMYADRIDRMLAGRDRTFEAVLGLGAFWDSNVTLESEEASATPSTGLQISGLALYRPLKGFVTLESAARFSQTLHQAPGATGFNASVLGAGLTAKLRKLANLRAGYDFSLLLLAGGKGLEQDSLYVFRESHLGRLVFDLVSNDSLRISPAYTGGVKLHDSLRRNVQEHSLETALALFFLEKRLKFFLIPSARVAQTLSPNDAYNVRAGGLRLACSASLGERYFLAVSAQGSLVDYPDSYGDFAAGTARQDTLASGGISFGWNATAHTALSLGVDYRRSWSSVGIFDYDATTVSLSLQERPPL